MRVGGKHRQTVRRRDIDPPTHHHVAIAIPIARRAKIRGVFAHHLRHQRMGPCRIGVRMQPAKIGQGDGVDHCAPGRTQTVFKNFNGIGPSDRVHRIHPHAKTALKERADGGEVKKALHQRGIIGHRVDHIDNHIADVLASDQSKIRILPLPDAILGHGRGARIDRLGHALRRGAAIGHVELDPKILLKPAGVVAGRQDDAAIRFVQPYQMAGRRS